MAETDAPLSFSPQAHGIFAPRPASGEFSPRVRLSRRSGSAAPFPPSALPPFSPPARRAVLDGLRSAIATIERGGALPSLPQGIRSPELPEQNEDQCPPASPGSLDSGLPRRPENVSANREPSGLSSWTFGDPAIDYWLSAEGLGEDGLVEIKPGAYADGAAAATLALLLATRRLETCAARGETARPILWCRPAALARDAGWLYGPGLPLLGLEPRALILAETASPADTLWAMEEGLRSGAVGLVLGCLGEIGLTPARRLALAAQVHRTPVLMLTDYRTEPTAATRSRWRIHRQKSAPHPFDPQAPGAIRLRLVLERSRGSPADVEPPSFLVEWCHDAYRFRVVADVADRADAQARRA